MSYEVNVASRVFAYEASRESLPDEDELQHRQIPWLYPNTPWKVTESKQTKDLPVLSFPPSISTSSGSPKSAASRQAQDPK